MKKAVIKVEVPDWQIGQKVSIYFPDTMCIKATCEAVKEKDCAKKITNTTDKETDFTQMTDQQIRDLLFKLTSWISEHCGHDLSTYTAWELDIIEKAALYGEEGECHDN